MSDANYKNICYPCENKGFNVNSELNYSLNDSYPEEPQPQYPAESSSPFQIKLGDSAWILYVLVALLVIFLIIHSR